MRNVDIGELVKKLVKFIEVELSSIVDPEGSADVQPTASFNALFSALSYIHNHLDMKWQPVQMLLSLFFLSVKATRFGFLNH